MLLLYRTQLEDNLWSLLDRNSLQHLRLRRLLSTRKCILRLRLCRIRASNLRRRLKHQLVQPSDIPA